MLCETCRQVVACIGTPPGSWSGPQPELFGYPESADTWRGAHHITDGSLVRSVREGCYICNPLLGAFPRKHRKRAKSSRTFFEVRPDGPQRWALRFNIELPAGLSTLDFPEELIECHGTFKILPKDGTLQTATIEHLTDEPASPKYRPHETQTHRQHL